MRYLCLILIAAVLSLGFISIQFLEKELIVRLADHNSRSVAGALVGAFWRKYATVFDLVNENPENISKIPQYYKFTNALRRFFYSMGLHQVNLFTKNGFWFFQLREGEGRPNLSELVAENSVLSLYQGSKRGEFIAVINVDDSADQDLQFFTMEIVYNFQYVLRWLNGIYAVFAIMLLISPAILLFWGYGRFYHLNSELKNQYRINAGLKNAKVMAEQHSLDKSKFLANITHELRTPLNSVIGFSQIISKGGLKDTRCIEYAQNIYTAGKHLLSLIDDILDFSKSEANKLQIRCDWFDLVRVIDLAYRMILPRAHEAGVELVKDASHPSIAMKADSRRMKQVLLNLLSNAVKFTPAGGQVRVSSAIEEGARIVLEVSDDGLGIAAHDVAKVMSNFGQVESYLSQKHSGSGLGLPLTRNLVKLMKGDFQLTSKPGSGTIIRLTFNYVKPDFG